MAPQIPDCTDTEREIVAMLLGHFIAFKAANGRSRTKGRRAVRRRS